MTIFVKFKWRAHSNHLNTVWYSNGIFVSSYQMVWYSNGGLKANQAEKVCLWSKMSGIWMVHQFRDFTIWIPDTHTVWYSGESCIQVFGNQMVINTWIPNSSEWVYGIHRQSSVKIHRHFAPAYLLGITRLLFTRLVDARSHSCSLVLSKSLTWLAV